MNFRPRILVIPSIVVAVAYLLQHADMKAGHIVPRALVAATSSTDSLLPASKWLFTISVAIAGGLDSTISKSDICFDALGYMEGTEDIMIERAYGQRVTPVSDDSLEVTYWRLANIVGNLECVKIMSHKFRPEDPQMNEVRTATWQHWILHRKHK